MIIGVGILLAAAVIIASVVTVPYYELVPGDAMSVTGLISLPKGQAHPLHGNILLTDVGVNTMRAIQFIPAWFNPDVQIVAQGQLTGDLPVSEFDAEGTVDMSESQLTAGAVALRQLGYGVPETDVGVTVYVIAPNSAAWRSSLQIGDVITAIDGQPTPNPPALEQIVESHKPGDRITLTAGTIEDPTKTRDVTLTLGSLVEKGVVHPYIGIGVNNPDAPGGFGTQPQYAMPFPVSISADNIGGPSAGLAFTLGIIDELTGGNLTGGRVVAATGTIDPDGSVGDVGGVAEKTIAVERAGATVFFVPPQEYALARSKATPQLKVFAVATLSQALTDLAHLGGTLGSASLGPPQGPAGHSVPYGWQNSPWT
ncbi:MAG: YlbL family protein [Acidimicrobiales bacterium]